MILEECKMSEETEIAKIKLDLDKRLKEYFNVSNDKPPDYIIKKIRKIAKRAEKLLRRQKDDN
jgi:hypothetical protein|tara:strand:- start:167 stop:355 length:189 start_codon:yes stop_codon:yes gene_type:complete